MDIHSEISQDLYTKSPMPNKHGKSKKAKKHSPKPLKKNKLKKASGGGTAGVSQKPRTSKASQKPLSKFERMVKANATEINELIERGRPRGFVTDNEILYYFPKIEDNVELLDEIYDRLEKAGIKVIETSALIDFSKDKDEKFDENLEFEGDVPDAVQMYLKEIGRTPLLNQRRGARACEAIGEGRRGSTPALDEGEFTSRGVHCKAVC